MAFQGDSIYWVEVEKIVPNPFQPRREFDENKLRELAESIRMYGVLQPLTVTRREVQREDGTFYSEYELIAGERRLRASKLGGVAQVPVIIREGEESEQEKLELAIIENLQREDLNAIDRAIAFKQLCEQFELSHSQVAKKVGRSREYVSNSVRLLALPEAIQSALKQGDLTEGHARTLLMLSDRPQQQDVIFREIVLKKLSVRESEKIIRKIASDRVRKKSPDEFDVNLIELEKRFTETLGTRVQIQKTEFGGKLTIDYFSEDDLATLLLRIKDEAPNNPSVAKAINTLAEHTSLDVVSVGKPSPSESENIQSSEVNNEAVAEQSPQPESDFSRFLASALESELSTSPAPAPASENTESAMQKPEVDAVLEETEVTETTQGEQEVVESVPQEMPGQAEHEPQEIETPPVEVTDDERIPSEVPSQDLLVQNSPSDKNLVPAVSENLPKPLEEAEVTREPSIEQTETEAGSAQSPAEPAIASAEAPVEAVADTKAEQAPAQSETTEDENSDESNLYSIRNFNV